MLKNRIRQRGVVRIIGVVTKPERHRDGVGCLPLILDIKGVDVALECCSSIVDVAGKRPVSPNPAGYARLKIINAGLDLGSLVPSDMDGNARPSYNGYEMGAYEYMSANGSFRILDWTEKR